MLASSSFLVIFSNVFINLLRFKIVGTLIKTFQIKPGQIEPIHYFCKFKLTKNGFAQGRIYGFLEGGRRIFKKVLQTFKNYVDQFLGQTN